MKVVRPHRLDHDGDRHSWLGPAKVVVESEAAHARRMERRERLRAREVAAAEREPVFGASDKAPRVVPAWVGLALLASLFVLAAVVALGFAVFSGSTAPGPVLSGTVVFKNYLGAQRCWQVTVRGDDGKVASDCVARADFDAATAGRPWTGAR